MTAKGRSISTKNHQHLWVQITKCLPLFIWLLFSCGLFSKTIFAAELSAGLRLKSTPLLSSSKNDFSHDKHQPAALPEDSESSDDPDAPNDPDDPEDTGSWEDVKVTVDDVWKTIYKFSVLSYLNTEQSVFSALTRSVQNRKVLPLFLVYRSWKSFLS